MTAPNAAKCIAAFALSQVGVPFRLHGRSPGRMLDCVGLVEASLLAAGYRLSAPADYSLRGEFSGIIEHFMMANGLRASSPDEIRIGDILVVTCGPQQTHLLIAVDTGAVHAHAGLRRVVFTPGPIAWPILQIWRGSN
jgi:hypothetical protein